VISFCIPYYNRRDRLAESLESIERQYGHIEAEIEIVIVDDGSDERLFIESRFPTQIHHLPKSGPLNPCVPINLAVKESSGSTIVLQSPEIVHHKPALLGLRDTWEGAKDYVAAPCWDKARGWIAGPQNNRKHRLPPGAHMPFCAMFQKNLFWEAGGYDEDYRHGQGWDDNDFLWRLDRAGAKFRCSEVPVVHVHERTHWKLKSNRDLFRRKWRSR